jgi:hypothetical protein
MAMTTHTGMDFFLEMEADEFIEWTGCVAKEVEEAEKR